VIVVDASAALDAAASRKGLALLEEFEPVAPPLMWSEALSVLHESLWRRTITQELAVVVHERITASAIERRLPEKLYAEAWRIAEQLGWAKTYDAEYVALARLLGCPLLTIDRRLMRGAGRVVQIIGPGDLPGRP
jgi:predicted nucleic acid-binding protein